MSSQPHVPTAAKQSRHDTPVAHGCTAGSAPAHGTAGRHINHEAPPPARRVRDVDLDALNGRHRVGHRHREHRRWRHARQVRLWPHLHIVACVLRAAEPALDVDAVDGDRGGAACVLSVDPEGERARAVGVCGVAG